MSHYELIIRIIDILSPMVATENEREALLIDAFYLSDPRLFYEIDRRGAASVFSNHLVKKLIDHGGQVEGRLPIAHVLFIARRHYGNDKHAEIDGLIEQSDSVGQSPPDPAPKPAASVTPALTQNSIQTIDTPREERRPTVFISYARADAEFANRLIADLNANGHACWIDKTSIKGGDEWITTIAEGVLNSYAMVVVATRRAIESRWAQDEIAWARRRNKPIIPLLLEDVADEASYFALAGYQGISVHDCDYATALPALLRALPPPSPARGVTEITAAGTHTGTRSLHRPPMEPRKAELAYLERLRLEELLDTDKYTPPGGAPQQQRQARGEMKTIFELPPIGKDPHAPREPQKFEDAVAAIRRIRRAVLLGEAGGGKTTTIWKLAAELVADAIEDRKAPIPLLVRLGRWTEADQSLSDFIASQLGDLGESLDLLLREKRAALLLDGLNELPAGQRDVKYPQVQKLIEQRPALMAVVSCRELDYTVDLGFDRINITPLDPLQIREFIGRYLGEEKGEALFWRLAGGAEAQTVWEVWRRAGASFELFSSALEIPKENPNVYAAASGGHDRIWRGKARGRHSLTELARNPYMLLMLARVYADLGELPENRGELFRLFVETLLKRERVPDGEHAPLTEGLAKVAYVRQIRRADDKAGDALTAPPKEEVNAILGERLLYLAGGAGILSMGEQARFTHQLLQEYFAARHMDQEIGAGRLKASEIWPPEKWWERTNWEEAAILLADLYSDDRSRVVEWVAEANPEVAAMCAARGGTELAKATGERLRIKWIPRLTDLKRDPKPKARAAIGRALGMMWLDNRKGVGAVVGANNVALPDIDWVEIPAGEFQYGAEVSWAAEPQKLTLLTFQISRYPITYAQFQTFLDDPEGFADPRWFEGMAAKDDERRMDEQYFKFANHPRERVSWYGAMAFCRWFSWRLGGGYDLKKVEEWAVRLPTEFEWEKAARGADGRIFPYKGDLDASNGNTEETGIGQTSAVGIFPSGASPYGVMDMSGNVWEWCLSDYEKPALEAWKENLRTDKRRVQRGGAWVDPQYLARAVTRVNSNLPADSNFSVIGFRVVGMLGWRTF